MPTRTGHGTPQRPHRPQHKPRPEQPKPSRLTALTPQNQSERPLLRGNQLYDLSWVRLTINGAAGKIVYNPQFKGPGDRALLVDEMVSFS